MALKTDKSIFYYNHRSGSVWVSKVMGRLFDCKDVTEKPSTVKGRDLKEYSFGLFNRHTGPNGTKEEDKEGRFSFCFVRHPISWYKSIWGARMGRDKRIDERFVLSSCWSQSFEEFVENSLEMFPEGFLTELYQCFVKEDLSGVDFIGRQENITNDLVTALTLAGEDFDENIIKEFKPINIALGWDKKHNLSKDLEERVLKSEEWVINNFYK